MTDGKWTCSTNEEHWNCHEEFDTREDALAYAKSELAAEMGVEDGSRVWVGQIHKITTAELAEHGASAFAVIENLDERLYELVGDEVVHELMPSKDDEADLDERLKVAIRDWMEARNVKPKCFTLDHVESHTWEQCKEGRSVPHAAHPDCDAVVERCVLHLEHEGDCEWL